MPSVSLSVLSLSWRRTSDESDVVYELDAMKKKKSAKVDVRIVGSHDTTHPGAIARARLCSLNSDCAANGSIGTVLSIPFRKCSS